jgi:hypothetical protein
MDHFQQEMAVLLLSQLLGTCLGVIATRRIRTPGWAISVAMLLSYTAASVALVTIVAIFLRPGSGLVGIKYDNVIVCSAPAPLIAGTVVAIACRRRRRRLLQEQGRCLSPEVEAVVRQRFSPVPKTQAGPRAIRPLEDHTIDGAPER